MRWHVVKTADPKVAGELVEPCPAEKRDRGSPIRYCPDFKVWVTNFKGSAHVDKWIKCVVWEERDGVQVGTLPSLNDGPADE